MSSPLIVEYLNEVEEGHLRLAATEEVLPKLVLDRGEPALDDGVDACAFYLFIRQPHGSEVSPAARNTPDSARIPRASKLLICGQFQKGRVLAQDGSA